MGVLNSPLPAELSEVWIDRDLSWLDFNERVLAEALDERTPLLERAKFLAIFTSNLDEFFMNASPCFARQAHRSSKGCSCSCERSCSRRLSFRPSACAFQ
jgi:polyphosphate kinase